MDAKPKKLKMTSTQGAKVYIKPVITKIQLIAEEAVLSTCKEGTAQSYDTCNAAGHNSCVQLGSS